MKLLHVVQIHWYNAEVQYAYDLAERLRARGHENHVLTRSASLSTRKAAERGFTVFGEDGFNAKGLSIWRAFPAARRLRRLLREEKYDAVIVHRSEGLPLIARACRAEGIPAVRVRGDMRRVRGDPMNRYVYRRLLSGVVSSNRTIEVELRRRIGAGVRCVTIPGGVDENFFRPEGARAGLRAELGLPDDAFLVGLMGRMARHKGFSDFIAAARETVRRREDAAFVLLVKHGLPLFEDLRAQLAADPVLAPRFFVLGHREDLPAVLRDFDLGVVASTESEANCRVGLEWMASGVPLVATAVGVLPDIVEEGVTGFLVPPGNPAPLAEAVSLLAADRPRAAGMGAAARRSVEERFTLDRCAVEHERFLREILSDRPR